MQSCRSCRSFIEPFDKTGYMCDLQPLNVPRIDQLSRDAQQLVANYESQTGIKVNVEDFNNVLDKSKSYWQLTPCPIFCGGAGGGESSSSAAPHPSLNQATIPAQCVCPGKLPIQVIESDAGQTVAKCYPSCVSIPESSSCNATTRCSWIEPEKRCRNCMAKGSKVGDVTYDRTKNGHPNPSTLLTKPRNPDASAIRGRTDFVDLRTIGQQCCSRKIYFGTETRGPDRYYTAHFPILCRAPNN
jgi:hypothetical protein